MGKIVSCGEKYFKVRTHSIISHFHTRITTFRMKFEMYVKLINRNITLRSDCFHIYEFDSTEIKLFPTIGFFSCAHLCYLLMEYFICFVYLLKLLLIEDGYCSESNQNCIGLKTNVLCLLRLK
jgi:hypothetical protein